jgi:hypothetical protein
MKNRLGGQFRTLRPLWVNAPKASSSVSSSPRYATATPEPISLKIDRTASPLSVFAGRISMPPSKGAKRRSPRSGVIDQMRFILRTTCSEISSLPRQWIATLAVLRSAKLESPSQAISLLTVSIAASMRASILAISFGGWECAFIRWAAPRGGAYLYLSQDHLRWAPI